MAEQTSLIPPSTEPFFIVTPPAARYSAGVTVLHLLCHYLNMAGESAFVVHFPPSAVPTRRLPHYAQFQSLGEIEPTLLTPILTEEVVDYYHQRKLTPIVIYPEVFDNPLNVKFFGRYILNYPGKLNTSYREREAFSIPYAETLGLYCREHYSDHPKPLEPLFVPTTDLTFWTGNAAPDRSATCYYAGKLKEIHGQKPLGVQSASIEIKRSSKEMNREEIRAIFLRSKAFYCYEDTALAIEAALCGCPTVFVANDHFSGIPLAAIETQSAGWCISDDLTELEKARIATSQMRSILQSHMNAFPALVKNVALKAKTLAREHKYSGTISYPYKSKLVFFDSDISFDESTVPEPEDLGELTPQFDAKNSLGAVLRADIIHDIAREVWYERQRWGIFYKLAKKIGAIPESGPKLSYLGKLVPTSVNEDTSEPSTELEADRPRGVELRPDVIRNIAREVWYERQRWGIFYKIGKKIKSLRRRLA